ncbi:Serine/threonine protein kinase [Colwellia chukchiensis]|uniref:Serine/threonine protein kinase n=1 Tax=Colwellia chukchiensis TaxID=641665 RepID=A0A1H7JAD8_9GAMM|nr:protein kinase [Colwellia chukchiensis]SEK71663.1 Serine/threonine protein kinase [Colwellia chukchiensis]
MSTSDEPTLSQSVANAQQTTQIIQPANALAAGECLVGRFIIKSLQGRGRYGCVYSAYDQQLDTIIAIKVLAPALSENAKNLANFKNELLLVRQLSHPNIIRVHEYYQQQNLHFITMDWIEGCSLEALMAQQAMSSTQIHHIIAQLLSGLAFAQQAGVTHKDIKPENIMLDTSGRLYIADFGLSVLNNEMTSASILGTPFYAPPEYLQLGKTNASTDLYAAGIVIYQLCCQRLPYTGASIDEITENKLVNKAKFTPINKDLKPLESWVLSLISPHSASRPANVNQAQQQYIALTSTQKTSRKIAIYYSAFALLLGLVVAMWWFIEQPSEIKANAKSHYGVAILPLANQEQELAESFANYLNYQLSEVSNLRVIEQPRLKQLFQQLGITLPLDDSKTELITDLLQVDVLISPKMVVAGTQSHEVMFELTFVDGFKVQHESLLRAAFNNKDWQDISASFVESVKRRLNIVASTTAQLTHSKTPIVDLFTITTLIAQGQYDKAQKALTPILNLHPHSAQAWLQQGELYLIQQLILEAEQAYAKAAEFAEKNTYTAKLASARLNDLAGKVEQAQADYLSLVQAFPYNTELKLMLAEFYFLIEQHQKMESLLLDVVAIDANHPKAWFMLGRAAFLQGNFEQALNEYFVKALVTAKKLKNPTKEGEALNAFGVVYEQLGETNLAFDYYQQALAMRKQAEDLMGAATTMLNLAAMHLAIGEYQQTEQYLQQSLTIYQKLSAQEGLSNTYNELGKLAEEQALYQNALENYRQALNIRIDLGHLMLQAESMNNIGFSYFMLLDADNALVFWRQAEQLYQQVKFPIGIIHVRQNLAQLELAKGNWRNAYHLFNNTLTDAKQLNSAEELLVSHSYLTKLAFLQGNFQASITELKALYAEAEKLHDVRVIAQLGLWLADWFLQLGDDKSATEHLNHIAVLVGKYGNKEYKTTLQFLRSQSRNNVTNSNFDSEKLVNDHAHQVIYIRQLILQARNALRAGAQDISHYLLPLSVIDFGLYQYQNIEYLELLAVQQYYTKDWTALSQTLREAELLLRKMGDYWRSFQFDRLRAQLAIVQQQDPKKYHDKVHSKLQNLARNLPAELLVSFLAKQNYYQLNDSLQEFQRNDQ